MVLITYIVHGKHSHSPMNAAFSSSGTTMAAATAAAQDVADNGQGRWQLVDRAAALGGGGGGEQRWTAAAVNGHERR